ncbi:putative DMSO reductase anchor subunit [uncultured delta proteobacterium]|uniref:Putative DMSO reductase anchor subunit n=1 Tax=uncultured delta proteobacterium TaxID=34034 RepID=A0A212JMN3_9DELT|nr:putative DMSO reductase anchor subunit [uncultured delta proteobacterium]
MNEWSLLIFTLALQVAVGGVVALALVDRLGSGRAGSRELGLFAVIAVAGSVFSLTHLGDMAGAYRALLHVSSSWLSREALLVVAFASLTVLAALFARKGNMTAILLPLAAIAGILLVFVSARVYAGTVVPKWTSSCPYADFFAAALLTGPFLVGCWRHDDPSDLRILRVLFGLGAVLFILNAGFFGGGVREPIAVARFLLAALGLVAGFRVLFGGASLPGVAAAGVVLLVLGEGVGRYMFFTL